MFHLIVENRLKNQYKFEKAECIFESCREFLFKTEKGIITVKRLTSEVLAEDNNILGYLR